MSRDFASWLKQQRLAAGVTQQELAAEARVSDSLVSAIEAGSRRPSPQTRGRLVAALHRLRARRLRQLADAELAEAEFAEATDAAGRC